MKKLLTAFFLILALTGCKSEKNIETEAEIKKDVKIQELKVQNIKTTKIYNGSIKPSNEITIVTPTGGYVKDIKEPSIREQSMGSASAAVLAMSGGDPMGS